ncbi:MAG: hypothetical protein KKE51_07780 [Gammaproteobacteria bacterium]|nr:hypothetical protein [Gammaproteobacteria bacterium]MBU2433095.1 hypothetical protein [Gammaproteobacteria bacterium]MBU2451009.1 hypothetical protein [Gammaproteobacteria bacterium]
MKSDRTQNASGALQKIGKQGNCAEAFAGLPVLSHFTKGFWRGQHEFANSLAIAVFNTLFKANRLGPSRSAVRSAESPFRRLQQHA